MSKRRAFIPWFLAGLVVWGLLVVGSFAALLAMVDEWRPITASALTDDPPKLWGPLFGQQYFAYRLGRIDRTEPEIVVLGSSRGSQFRAEMFPGTRFYNASLAATSLGDSIAFLEAILRARRPRIVILPIDTWWFSPTWADPCADAGDCTIPHEFSLDQLVAATTRSMQSSFVLYQVMFVLSERKWLALRAVPDPIGGRMPVGFLAQQGADGFRPDGSYQYGRMALGDYGGVTRDRLRFTEGYAGFIDRLDPVAAASSGNRFGTVSPLPPARVAALERFVEICHQHDAKVVLVLPPFAPGFMKLIERYPQQAAFFSDVATMVKAVAQRHQVDVLDAMRSTGDLGDEHFYDGMHGDERVHLALARKLVALPVLAAVVDRDALATLARTAAGRGDAGIWLHLIAR